MSQEFIVYKNLPKYIKYAFGGISSIDSFDLSEDAFLIAYKKHNNMIFNISDRIKFIMITPVDKKDQEIVKNPRGYIKCGADVAIFLIYPRDNVFSKRGAEGLTDRLVRLIPMEVLEVVVPESSIVPVHRRYTGDTEAILAKDLEILPKISVNDPAAIWYGLTAGSVVEVMRVSATTGYTPVYRLVIPDD